MPARIGRILREAFPTIERRTTSRFTWPNGERERVGVDDDDATVYGGTRRWSSAGAAPPLREAVGRVAFVVRCRRCWIWSTSLSILKDERLAFVHRW